MLRGQETRALQVIQWGSKVQAWDPWVQSTLQFVQGTFFMRGHKKGTVYPPAYTRHRIHFFIVQYISWLPICPAALLPGFVQVIQKSEPLPRIQGKPKFQRLYTGCMCKFRV